jgi:hypothetical protein
MCYRHLGGKKFATGTTQRTDDDNVTLHFFFLRKVWQSKLATSWIASKKNKNKPFIRACQYSSR